MAKKSKINKKNVLNTILLIVVTALVLYFSLKDDFFTTIHEILTLNYYDPMIIVGALTTILILIYSIF